MVDNEKWREKLPRPAERNIALHVTPAAERAIRAAIPGCLTNRSGGAVVTAVPGTWPLFLTARIAFWRWDCMIPIRRSGCAFCSRKAGPHQRGLV
jgi:hypothetical protein